MMRAEGSTKNQNHEFSALNFIRFFKLNLILFKMPSSQAIFTYIMLLCIVLVSQCMHQIPAKNSWSELRVGQKPKSWIFRSLFMRFFKPKLILFKMPSSQAIFNYIVLLCIVLVSQCIHQIPAKNSWWELRVGQKTKIMNFQLSILWGFSNLH